MPVRVVRWFSRADLKAEPASLFAFGDNIVRSGRGGQAKEARGELNAVGIPTKWRPDTSEDAYFEDSDIHTVRPFIDHAFGLLEAHLRNGGTVVWPEAGVGTGLSQLEKRAPRIAEYLQSRTKRLFECGR